MVAELLGADTTGMTEDEAAAAFSQLGCNAEQVHLKQLLGEAKPHRKLADYDALFLPGGFSAGDYVRAGAIFAARLRAGLRGFGRRIAVSNSSGRRAVVR